MKSICEIDCNECHLKSSCAGCLETNGKPFGGNCIAAQCYLNGGETKFFEFKNQLIKEFNELNVKDMPSITELYQLAGSYVNLEYTLQSGIKAKFLDDTAVYLGNQVEKKGTDKCYGLVADDKYLLVCEYEAEGKNPEIVVYKKR